MMLFTKKKDMKVLYFAAECKPYSKDGGVGDVAGELPPALRRAGVDITIVTPFYDCVNARKNKVSKKPFKEYVVEFGDGHQEVELYKAKLDGVPVILVKNRAYLSKGPYVHSHDFPYKDDAIRFSFFAEACLPLLKDYDIVHGNDWVTGFLFGRMKIEGKNQKKVLTVHNIGYQGNMWEPNVQGMPFVGLRDNPLTYKQFKDPRSKWQSVNPLRLALELADMVNAVSPTYAKEILEREDQDRYFEGGKGLDGVCRRLDSEGRLVGILNGLDYKAKSIAKPTREEFEKLLEQKKDMKALVSRYFKNPNNMLLGFVGRAVEQKFRLLTEELDGKSVLEHILAIPGLNVAILATGLPEYQSFMNNISIKGFRGKVGYSDLLSMDPYMPIRNNYASFVAFDKDMRDKINLGSDAFLMPSLFEPCGITQLEALSTATPPIVRWTGGLVDTVTDETGFGFDGETKEEVLSNLVDTVKKARGVFQDRESFLAMQLNAFRQRFLWSDAAKQYVKMYEQVLRNG